MELFPFGASNPADRFDVLLYCRAVCSDGLTGRWQFALEDAHGETILEADDHDAGDLNRLTLLALVRGLEAIDGESSVTLLSTNRYVIRSLTDHLPRWRENEFVWEHFGRYSEIQNSDLWRRVDRALQIHRVEACLVQSRLISDGRGRESDRPASPAVPSPAVSKSADDDAPILRADTAHSPAGPRRIPNAPVPTRDRGSRPMADPLRRFLLTCEQSARVRHGRRFTAADLAGN